MRDRSVLGLGAVLVAAGSALAQSPDAAAWRPSTHPAAVRLSAPETTPVAEVTLPPLVVPGPAPAAPAAPAPVAPAALAVSLAPPRPAATLGDVRPADGAVAEAAPRAPVVRAQSAGADDRSRDRPLSSFTRDEDPLLAPAGVGVRSPVSAAPGMDAFGRPAPAEELYNSGAVTTPAESRESRLKKAGAGDRFDRKNDPFSWWDHRSRSDFGKSGEGGFSFDFGRYFQRPDGQGAAFSSDPCFDQFISPVTNPFLFEDPRSLTEVRPILIYQTIANSAPFFQGGDVLFVGARGSVALTDRLSFTINKLGGIGIYPDNNTFFPDSFGFAEVWLGGKYTFIRNPDSGTLLAGGAIFQIPAGDDKVFQHTGDLSVVPYVSFGQNLKVLPQRFGNINILDTLGFSFSTNDQRSNYFYNSFHIDYNVAGLNRIYPLVELNWFHYTRSGEASFIGMEGTDLVNFGAQGIEGRDYLTLAVGGRYKLARFGEHIQLGGALEFPLIAPNDLNRFRLTFDVIFRY
jgi:hypothetical protein